MPPEQQNQQPDAAKGDFNFILNNQQAQKKAFGIPKLSKTLWSLIGVIILMIVIIIIGSITKTSNGGTSLYSVVAEANQIINVSKTVSSQSKNSDVINIATSVSEVLGSQKLQLTALVPNAKSKSVAAKLSSNPNKTIDANLLSAQAKGTYDDTYISYLKSALTDYQTELNTAYNTGSAKAKPVISSAYESTKTLLTSPQFK